MKMRKQKCIGLVLVAASIALLVLASAGSTPEERDATAVLLTLGIYMTVTPNYVLIDRDPTADQPPHDTKGA